MKTESKKYILLPSSMIVREGEVSLYRVLRDGNLSEELLEKYYKDVKGFLYDRLERLSTLYPIPEKEIKRIKDLVEELVHVAVVQCETSEKYCGDCRRK